MRIKVELQSKDFIILKKGFVRSLQGMIYKLLDESYAEWLHDTGFVYEKRQFRLFTFSSILEKGTYNKKLSIFIFPNKVSFYISSPIDWILEQTSKNFIMKYKLFLGSTRVNIHGITVMKNPIISNNIKVRAITPISIRSTYLLNGKNRFRTHSPDEELFSDLINNNAKKKWQALYKQECPYNIQIGPLFKDSEKYKRIVQYGSKEKKVFIEGYKGSYIIKGDPELIEFCYYAGFGERNSQGFGMVDII